ncbi:MAG: ATP-binding cassette domain-containing protein, partial [Desulfococcaceae bacterium]
MESVPPALIQFSDAAIRLRDRRVIQELTWKIRPGENWAVIGPNGAGKSSLARALTGELATVAGRLNRGIPAGAVVCVGFESGRRLLEREVLRAEADHFAGRIDGGAPAGSEIGAEFENPPAIHSQGVPQGAIGGNGEAIQRLGMSNRLDRPVDRLSTGELRKLLILRALSQNPRLLVLDEPFDGLDAESRRELAAFLAERMAAGVQMVLATHRAEELLPGIGHVLALRNGRIAAAGPRNELPSDFQSWIAAKAPDPINGRPIPKAPTPSPPPPPVLVEMTDVAVRYGDTPIFSNLHWRVVPGQHWAVSGPNGAGKSTLLRLIAGDHPQAYANRIHLFGRRRGTGESIWDIRRRAGIVSGDLQLRYRRPLTVRETVLSGFFDSVGLFRRASAEQAAAAGEWLRLLDLQEYADRRFDRLSCGEQRMVLVARAAVKRPWLLILDEPCQGLDPDNRARVLALADRIGRDQIGSDGRTTLLWVSHHDEERPPCVRHRLR